jgi:hypothetical protein
MMNTVRTVSLVILVSLYGNAQPLHTDTSSTNRKASLTVSSATESAPVLIDSILVGRTPLTVDTLAPGLHHIRVVHPDLDNWLTSSVFDTLVLRPGETRSVRYTFESRYLLTSTPSGADILSGDSLVGRTPILLNANKMQPAITLKKNGYEVSTFDVVNVERGVLGVVLKKKWQRELEDDPVFNDANGKGPDNLGLYITGATTVLSGVAAAYFKVRADDRYASYLSNGNPSLLSETNRLDTVAGVALVATQLSLGLFTYFILSR